MKIERLTIQNTWGDSSTIGTITDPTEMRNFFTNEMICADTDFYFKGNQYYIEEVHLSYLSEGLVEVIISVEVPNI